MTFDQVREQFRSSLSQYFTVEQLEEVLDMAMVEFVTILRQELDSVNSSLSDQEIVEELVRRSGLEDANNLTNQFISGMLEELN